MKGFYTVFRAAFATALAPVLFFSVIFLGAAGFASAQIDQGELEKNLAPVTFTNYEGPHAKIETREQIRQIGVGLGQAVKSGSARVGAASRYFVIHSVSDRDGDKLDADIFGLGPGVGVDHIRNLRWIIQGYLQEAYDYSASDAALLAEYITIYNAVYRGNWDYFSSRYKDPVVQNLNEQHAGLSTRYNEWPGRTLMVIPLGIGGLSSIDTTAISDSRVVEEMRREDDMSIEQRRDMVDLKEREADQAEKKAADQRQNIQQEEKKIAEERTQVQQDRQQIAEDKSSGEDTTAREAEADQKSDELDQREEELVLQREEADEQEQFAEQKTEEAQADRDSIAQDQQTLIDNQQAQAAQSGTQPAQGGTSATGGAAAAADTQTNLLGVMIERDGAALGRLVTFDAATRRELRRSPLDTAYVRTVTFIGGKVIAIAGENQGAGAVRLVEINSRTLEMAKQGEDDISPNSLIWVNGNDLYAITTNLADGTLYLGRFNADLALQAKSVITVHTNATVNIQQGNLLTQRADGTAAILDPATLAEK